MDLVVEHYDLYYRMVAMTIMMMIMTINDKYPCNVREYRLGKKVNRES